MTPIVFTVAGKPAVPLGRRHPCEACGTGLARAGRRFCSRSCVPRPALADRLWAKVDQGGADECWIWLGGTSGDGYGRIRRGGDDRVMLSAHRVAYELLIGPIPEGLTLDHFRLNPGPRQAPCSRACVNPAHVEPVSGRENVLRGKTHAARNAAKTHCPKGHAYDALSRGERRCRTCLRGQARARRSR